MLDSKSGIPWINSGRNSQLGLIIPCSWISLRQVPASFTFAVRFPFLQEKNAVLFQFRRCASNAEWWLNLNWILPSEVPKFLQTSTWHEFGSSDGDHFGMKHIIFRFFMCNDVCIKKSIHIFYVHVKFWRCWNWQFQVFKFPPAWFHPVFPESATRFFSGLLPVLLCGATDRDDMPLVQWQGAKIVSSWDRWSQTPWRILWKSMGHGKTSGRLVTYALGIQKQREMVENGTYRYYAC